MLYSFLFAKKARHCLDTSHTLYHIICYILATSRCDRSKEARRETSSTRKSKMLDREERNVPL